MTTLPPIHSNINSPIQIQKKSDRFSNLVTQSPHPFRKSFKNHLIEQNNSPVKLKYNLKSNISTTENSHSLSQFSHESFEDKKLSSSGLDSSSKKLETQTPQTLTYLDYIPLNNEFDKLHKSDFILKNRDFMQPKRSLIRLNPLNSKKEAHKLDYIKFRDSQNFEKNEVNNDKIKQKLMRLNSPVEEEEPFSHKVIRNQIKSLSNLDLSNKRIVRNDRQNINQNVLKFNTNFKNIDKIIDSNTHFSIENSLDIAMLSATSNTNILPKKLGILDNQYKIDSIPLLNQLENKKFELNLSNQNLSKGYTKMISQALLHSDMSELRVLKLNNTNLTQKSLLETTQHLPQSIRQIDLEQNHLGQEGGSGIIYLLNPKVYPNLTILNIENNQIGDLGFNSIQCSLLKCQLSVLNLSKNNLTDVSSEGISQFLKESQEIIELYLHWNKFSSQGGFAIAKGVESNISLQVLDLSYNGLGNPKRVNAGLKIIKSCSTKLSTLKHLDLSFNMISLVEIQEIASYLKNNTTLFGLHIMGNQDDWVVDSRGFLVQKQIQIGEIRTEQIHCSKQRMKGLRSVKQKDRLNDMITKDICWICEGWQEVTFEITAQKSNSFAKSPVFLHLDFENFRPHFMDADQNNSDKFVLKRMCPPNRKIQFFFSDPTQKVLFYSHDYPSMGFTRNSQLKSEAYKEKQQHLKNQIKSCGISPKSCSDSKGNKERNFFQKRIIKFQYLDTTVIDYQEPFLVNWIETIPNTKLFSEGDQEPVIECRPRWPETYFKINFSEGWTFEKSLFSSYVRDSEDLIDKCFEFDWESSRLDKLLNTYTTNKNIKYRCKQILKNQYGLLKNHYKYYSSLGMIGDIPAISQNLFFSIASKMKIADGKIYKIADIDYNFITVNSNINKEKNYRNPDKAIIRFEYLEILSRIAIDKFVRTNTCRNPEDSLEMFFGNDNLRQQLEDLENSQEWRDRKYWNESCDKMLNNYLDFIQEIWNKYANSRKGEKRTFQMTKTMDIYEFSEMIKQFNLLDDLFTERDIPLAFNLAIMTQIDELNSDRYISMTFVEFLEALARIADKKSLEPIGSVDGTYTIQERQELRLEFKIESLIEQMCGKYFIGNNKKDRKSSNSQSQNQATNHKPLVPSISLTNIQRTLNSINSS